MRRAGPGGPPPRHARALSPAGPREAARVREIRDYYRRIDDDELVSSLAPARAGLWGLLARHRAALGIGRRWLEVGGGRGDLAARALGRGYDVTLTDVFPGLLRVAVRRHPALAARCRRLDLFDPAAVARLAAEGPWDVVAALGAVLSHARDLQALRRGFDHLVRLAAPDALLVVDVLLREAHPGHPRALWSEFRHVLAGLDDLHRLVRRHRLGILEAHTLFHRYPANARAPALDERTLRLVLHRAGRGSGAQPPQTHFRQFAPHGSVVIAAESRISPPRR